MSESEKGTKFDDGKLQWYLMPWEELEEVVRVLMHGAKKYNPDNWKYVTPTTRYIDAAIRHIVAHTKGEECDPEDGFSHMAHAICCCLFLDWHRKNNKKNNIKNSSVCFSSCEECEQNGLIVKVDEMKGYFVDCPNCGEVGTNIYKTPILAIEQFNLSEEIPKEKWENRIPFSEAKKIHEANLKEEKDVKGNNPRRRNRFET